MAVSVAAPNAARAEFLLGIYGGVSGTFDSDVDVDQSGTDLTLDDVPFDGEPFENPVYYGVRGTYWLNQAPQFGVMLDFTHAKAIADEDADVHVSGDPGGLALGGSDVPVGAVFDDLQFSHGLNTITLNGLYRHPFSWVTPYAGLGLGVSVPHVEVQLNGGPSTEEYQFGGVAAQALAGLEFALGDRFALFAEYKFSYTPLDIDLDGGGSLQTDLFTNHAMLGLSVRFGGGAPGK